MDAATYEPSGSCIAVYIAVTHVPVNMDCPVYDDVGKDAVGFVIIPPPAPAIEAPKAAIETVGEIYTAGPLLLEVISGDFPLPDEDELLPPDCTR
jgi:hypothetical protein